VESTKETLGNAVRGDRSSPSPEVRMFWTGPQFSPYEELSLRSFVAAGARVLLYATDLQLRVPSGVELIDVREILSERVRQFTFADGDRSPALHSDLFRYAVLERFGGWYADLDIICVGKKLPECKVYIARESDDLVNGAVLKFPAQSPVIAAAIDRAWKVLPETRAGAPLRMRVSIGPALLTELAHEYAFDHLVRPRSSAYEIGYDEIPALFDPVFREQLEERVAASDFIHLWNEIWRRTRIPKNYGPPAGSFLDGLFRRFGMTFADEARLSTETVNVWFQERRLLTEVAACLQTETIPPDAFHLLLKRFRKPEEALPSRSSSPPAPIRHRRPGTNAPQVVRTFWQGGPMGPYQLLGLRSFIDRGHRVEVFTYDSGMTVPDWIERKNAADILPAERVLRDLPDEKRSAINASLFRSALLHRLGGWWIDPDVVLLRSELPPDEVFCGGLTEFGTVSTAAVKFPAAHPVLADTLVSAASFEDEVAEWDTAGMPLLTRCIRESGLSACIRPLDIVSPISWFDVPRLFDPDEADAVAEASKGKVFLDLHFEVWLRAGIPGYLGPPRGSYLDRLFKLHDVELMFPAFMEFDDVRRWLSHMYAHLTDKLPS
jgi:hypothetical protein